MPETSTSREPPVTLYALQTCAHCKSTRKYLEALNADFKTIYVDMLTGDERNSALRRLRKLNPGMTFPTVVTQDTVIVGFKKDEIEKAVKAGSA